MKPSGKAALLFDAFSAINARAYENERLLSCPNLSKAPNYGDILARFSARADIEPVGLATALGQALRYMLTNMGHFIYILLGKIFIFLLGWRTPKDLYAENALIIDTFALLHPIAEQERYEERYLPGLAEVARKRDRRPVMFYRLYGPRSPRLLWRALKVLARSGAGVTEFHLLSVVDWLRLIPHSFFYVPARQRLICSLQPAAGLSPEAYIQDALARTFGQCIMVGEARRLSGYRLGLALSSGAKVVSWFENQTVDKTFQAGFKKACIEKGRYVQTIGAQLLTWPANLLNNHADDVEAILGIVPDKVLVNGPYFLPDKTRQNYAVGPSLRYRPLFDETVKKPAGTDPLLVILSYHPDETRQVLRLVRPLADAGQALAYRFHPATRAEDFKDDLPPGEIPLAGGNLYKALEGKCAVIGSGSGALAEAACLGLPALSVRNSDADLEYLPEYGKGKIWEGVRSLEDIQTALDSLRNFRAGPEYEQTRLAFRNLLFTEPTEDAVVSAFEL